jgi:hypothetical protein
MQPIPDHGEKSDLGSGRLERRKALVTGGDPGIGRAAAIACAREGADVATGNLPQEECNAKEVIALRRVGASSSARLPARWPAGLARAHSLPNFCYGLREFVAGRNRKFGWTPTRVSTQWPDLRPLFMATPEQMFPAVRSPGRHAGIGGGDRPGLPLRPPARTQEIQ